MMAIAPQVNTMSAIPSGPVNDAIRRFAGNNRSNHQTNFINCGAKLPWPIGWNSVWNTSRTTAATTNDPTMAITQSVTHLLG